MCRRSCQRNRLIFAPSHAFPSAANVVKASPFLRRENKPGLARPTDRASRAVCRVLRCSAVYAGSCPLFAVAPWTVIRPPCRSTLSQVSANSSPRRMPVFSETITSGFRWSAKAPSAGRAAARNRESPARRSRNRARRRIRSSRSSRAAATGFFVCRQEPRRARDIDLGALNGRDRAGIEQSPSDRLVQQQPGALRDRG